MLMQYLENVYQQYPKCQKLHGFATIYFRRSPAIQEGYNHFLSPKGFPAANAVAKPVPTAQKAHHSETIIKLL